MIEPKIGCRNSGRRGTRCRRARPRAKAISAASRGKATQAKLFERSGAVESIGQDVFASGEDAMCAETSAEFTGKID